MTDTNDRDRVNGHSGAGAGDGGVAALLSEKARTVLNEIRAEVAERPARVGVLFPAAARRVARGAGPSGDPTGTEGPTLEDLVRVDLLRVLSEVLPPGDLAREVEDLYEYGDADERRAVLRGLCGLGPKGRSPEVAAASRRLLADAVRTNDTRLVAAAAASGAQDLLDDHSWRQTVLKCLFVGVPLRLVAGLEERADAELARMCADFARERERAGRAVPADVHLVLERFPASTTNPNPRSPEA